MEDFLSNLGIIDDNSKIKGIVESVLFAVAEPISLKEIGNILNIKEKELLHIIYQMKNEYDTQSRGICILEFDDKIQLATKQEYSEYVKKIVKPESRQNLSQAALETLSIIAYRQPITKVALEEVRGVRSERPIATLIENSLIKEDGRMETTGRPILYSTTDEFLKYFGFKNISELPELIEFNMKKEEE